MRRLILHIGLPKTGTTSLQKYLFPNLPNVYYLGKFHGQDINHEPIVSNIPDDQHMLVYSNEDITNPYCESTISKINELIHVARPDKVIILWGTRDPIHWARSWFNAGFESANVKYKDFLKASLCLDNQFSTCILNFDIKKICKQLDRYDDLINLKVVENHYTMQSVETLAEIFQVDVTEVKSLLLSRTNAKKGGLYLFFKKVVVNNIFLFSAYKHLPILVQALGKKIVRTLSALTKHMDGRHDNDIELLEESLKREFEK